jgi:hypothetical protein
MQRPRSSAANPSQPFAFITHQLDEAAVARGAGVGRHDAVEGPVVPPEALQADADDHCTMLCGGMLGG